MARLVLLFGQMSLALESVCEKLELNLTDDPATRLIASKILELAQRGVRDAPTLSAMTLKEFKALLISIQQKVPPSACPLWSRTTKHAGCSSMDHGGGKWRAGKGLARLTCLHSESD